MNKTCIAALLLAAATGAHPHVTVEPAQTLAGTATKLAFRVGHGCEGSATHTLIVRIPEGFGGAKPMPKAGWTLDVTRAPLDQPYESHGRKISEDVVQIRWRANQREAWLQDAWYDEFIIHGQAPTQAGPLWFKVQQLCEQGSGNWAEVPAEGRSTQGLKAPAALLEVLPNEHAAHQH